MLRLTRRELIAAGASSIAAHLLPMFAAEAAPLTYTIKPVKIGDGAWMIAGVNEAITFENGGAIANITILDSTAGAIIVDTGPSRRFGEQLAIVAKELTGKSVARVYVTHFHPDHVFGNQAFAPGTLAAPQGVIDGLKIMGNGFSDAMYYIARDWMRGTEIVLPEKAVATGVEEIGGRRLNLFALAGHTASDLAIYEEKSGLLITGDLTFLDRAPTTPHANLPVWSTTLAQLEKLQPSKIVPGHGPAENGARAITQTREWLEAIDGIITKAYEKGLDILEAAAEPLPASLKQIALSRYEFERSVMHLYPKLESARLPAVGKKAD